MIDVDEICDTSAVTPFDQFYGIEVSDNDILDAAETLENVVPGLGDWYLGIDPDCEIQRDLLALGRLFWEHKKGPCKCSCAAEHHSQPSTIPQAKPREAALLRGGKASQGKAPLAKLRLARGLSQRQLAEMIGATQATICRLENEAVHMNLVRTYIRTGLERVFQVPFDQLLLIKTEQPN